jgi:hypothetical protein
LKPHLESIVEKPVCLSCLVLALALVSGACGEPFGEVAPACEGWKSGDVVITELLPDPAGTDTGQEWLEVHNPGPSAVDLRGLLLYAARTDGSQERAYLFEESVPLESRAYAVLGDVRVGAPPAHVTHAYGDALGALGNAGGLVGLRCGDVVVDEVRYTGSGRSGVSRIYDGRLVPDALGNDEPDRWCDAPVSATEGGSRASPGVANPACGPDASVDTCLSPGTGVARSVSRPRPGDLVITEFMADPKASADSVGEWVEVYALRDVDLNGVSLTNEGTGRALLDGSPRCLELRAGTFGVLARTAEPSVNGGLPPVLGTFAFGLSNTAEPHALRLSLEGTLLDEVRWTGASVSGVSRQLDPSKKDALHNDAAENFCLTPEGVGYGSGDRGTPGAENRPCAR